ncbi:hypothetical protein AncyloWKF20_10555 [Ancylobacter sp. WKF20]|uniref:hypothetical protein n=1 Tax=Ancylobacter sp. WKF20 TaxID=3039801 RepID=UPI00243420F0|nr:hypothetical protein [Ancylobacter sp. WKF20]WGD32225.1 hypothetical protein AncyloWKF20_10555 [Ancylobacter sp. WKF20]
MTTLTLNLTATLQSTLTAGGASNGVSAYAVYFDTSGAANFTTLVDNGGLQGTGTYIINLPTMPAGKIYFLIQSQDSSEPYDLTSLIQDQADINWANAATWGVRYDSFEFSLEGQTGDAGNLTSVESFGLPMEVEVEYQDGSNVVRATDTRGYNVSGSTFFTDLSGTATGVIYTYTDGALAGDNRMAIGPATAVVPGSGSTSFQASDWDTYIDSLQTQSGTTGVFISGFFNGAVDANNVYHNAGYYSYELTWDPTHQNADSTVGTFWLSPTDSQISGYSTIAGFSQIQGYIQITPDQLANSIYSTLGSAYIYSDPTSSTPYNIALSPGAMNTGANNQWGEVLTQLLTGFSAGYIGMSGTSLNSGVTQAINLSNNSNWDPTYAFGRNLAGGDVPDHVDPYSNLFFLNTNSYGSNYSDNLMSAYSNGGPLISLYSPYSQTDVSNINLTIFDDSETPTGYVTPTIDNYINATFDPAVATASGISIGLNFFNQMVMLDDTVASITLRFQTADGWQELELSAAANTSTGNPGSLWDDWTIVQNGDGTFSVSAGGNAQTTGALVITNPPAPANGVAWYQLVVHDVDDPGGTAANAKTFNLYATTSGSLFVNPAYSGQAGSLAVDGLAIVAPQASSASTILTFSVDFLYAATSTIDASLLTTNLPDALSIFHSLYGNSTLPTAAVVGDMSSGSFVAGTGQTTTTAPVATLQSGELAFGWTGYNPLAWTTNGSGDTIGSSWISQYSNKIGAGNLARLTFAGTSLMPVAAIGDIDGQWLSGTHNFGNGTYTATFIEYLSSDTTFANPLTPTSSTLNFTVNVAEVDLLAATSGVGLALDGGGAGVAGNWIYLQTLSIGSGGLPPDATLILYATDASGNLVARDGTIGPGVTLADAALGNIGNILSDSDAQLLSGSQMVYLGLGQELRFAVKAGSGAIDMAPNVTINVQADGSAEIDVGSFRLSAVTDNTLDAAAELASAQHRYDEALVYLTHGAMIEVELTGSSANTNTLGFVRFDMDAQGNLSVDGVAYGNNDAFRAAVVDNLDPGFLVARGGQTSIDRTWTVQGSDGYYAPVLLTQNGDIFVPGTGNSGGHEYIRIFGENMFGFEDLTAAQNSDFDYNDMAMRLTPMQSIF